MVDLQLSGVGRVFKSPDGAPEVVALRSVDLYIPQGDYVAIVGPSGGGKSTLLNLLGLLDEPSSGSYSLGGELAPSGNSRTAAAIRSAKIGFVFQSFHLLDRRRVAESVALATRYQPLPRDQKASRTVRALDAVGLLGKMDALASTLSGGERQRVAVARAIAAGSSVILADEPTGNLDSANADRVLAELERLNADGATVVVVTHSHDVASRARRRIQVVDGVVAELEQEVEVAKGAVRGPIFTPGARIKAPSAVEMAADAWSSVTSLRAQSLAFVLAIAVAVALFVIAVGISSTAAAQVTGAFDAQLNREVTATWTTEDPRGSDPERVLESIRSIAGVSSAAVVADGGAVEVRSHAVAVTVQPHVVHGSASAALRLTVRTGQGGWSTPLASNEVLLGDLLARRLELGPIEGRPSVQVDGERFVVVGLITQSERLPLLTGELIMSGDSDGSSSGQLDLSALITTVPGAALQVADQTPAAINPYAPAAVNVSSPTDSAELRGVVQGEVKATLFALTSFAGLAAIAFVINSAVSGVVSRRAEFGLRKAVGARDNAVAALVVVETIMRGAVGGTVGLGLGVVSLLLISMVNRWLPVLDLWALPAALIAGASIGALAGVIAARTATQTTAAEALRS